ncbi:MAG: acetyl-CoA C-acetyltransferase [Geobacteraceae bacterium]|nr:acetyl-CoA C-acetyltransferase [Geobacteraceae bacterium]
MAEEVVILSGVRTAIGKFGGTLKDTPACLLGAAVIGEAATRAGVPMEAIDEVIMGNVISAGLGQNPARQAAVRAGVPVDRGAVTVNKVCGSGLKAVLLAAQAIRAGDAELVVAGGMENMSSAPHLLSDMRWGLKTGDSRVRDAMLCDGLWDAFHGYHMGITGERVAAKYGITREEADEFALESNTRAYAAQKNGRFAGEIVPVKVPGAEFASDECIRGDTSADRLAALEPVFVKNGLLTAGNSSKLADGAAALVVASAGMAARMGKKPLARIAGYAVSGVAPEDVMEAPVPAMRRLLAKTGLAVSDLDLVEHNEAYAAASLAIARELAIDRRRLNPNGGAIALGHPLGCSGARILVTLLYALMNRDLRKGAATLCMGGGNGIAMLIERE